LMLAKELELPADVLNGARLYGDDFSLEEVAEWYADEVEGYAGLIKDHGRQYSYSYHALNIRHGYRQLGNRRFARVLGLGSAYGDELRPIIDRMDSVTILDPSDEFPVSEIAGVPVSYAKPEVSGRIGFEDGSFDLVTCFGTLHHIPNVSFVIKEIGRILNRDGIALIREPISSMGDWRRPRPGLTKRERGIPIRIMNAALRDAGLKIRASTPCMQAGLAHVLRRCSGIEAFNSPFWVRVDEMICRITQMNSAYWRMSRLRKIAPSSVFIVAVKDI
jgi:SAM-dependent methyltransferase